MPDLYGYTAVQQERDALPAETGPYASSENSVIAVTANPDVSSIAMSINWYVSGEPNKGTARSARPSCDMTQLRTPVVITPGAGHVHGVNSSVVGSGSIGDGTLPVTGTAYVSVPAPVPVTNSVQPHTNVESGPGAVALYTMNAHGAPARSCAPACAMQEIGRHFVHGAFTGGSMLSVRTSTGWPTFAVAVTKCALRNTRPHGTISSVN